MNITTIGINLAKSVFQVHGIGNIDSNLVANQRHNISLVGLEPRQCRSHLRAN